LLSLEKTIANQKNFIEPTIDILPEEDSEEYSKITTKKL
jgi:hypothetical protein